MKQTPQKINTEVIDPRIDTKDLSETMNSPSIEVGFSFYRYQIKKKRKKNNFLYFLQEDVSENSDQQLTSTKENLKHFIERWEEHPNSPYIFDSNSTLILPRYDNEKNTSSGFSSRGCSPSPCESLSSNAELNTVGQNNETFEEKTDAESNVEFNTKAKPPQKEIFERSNSATSVIKQNKEYLQSFDRRHSDSNYVVRNRTSSLEKVDLAEEIRKLSDRLMILSNINDELQEFNRNMNQTNNEKSATDEENLTKRTETMTNTKISNFGDHFSTTIEVNEKSGKKTYKEKITIHSKSKLFEDESTSQSTKSVVNDLTERLKTLDEMPSVFKKLVHVKNLTEKDDEIVSTSNKENFHLAASLSSNSSKSTSPCNGLMHQTAPWPITTRRTKFRITQMSRDVPIDSPDSHPTIFLEEAANTTKDCLLHLLDKYNAKGSRSSSSIRRHQSISGHGISDNLEYHSMNSINAFFKRNAFQHNGTTVRKLRARIESKDE